MAVKRGRGRVGAGARPSGGGGRSRGRGRGGDSVGQFLAPHTGRQAGAVANAEAGAEFNPGIRQGRQEARGSRKREGDLGQWYEQLAADYQGAQDQGAAALKSVEDTTTKQLGEANDRSSSDQARLASEDEAFAKLVGGPKDTAGLAKIAQAGAAASASRVDASKLAPDEQANFVARLGADKTAARMQGIEARQSERERRDKILSDVTAQRKEKGSARVAATEKIRESDRSYVNELKKLKLARREAQTAAQAAAADAALAQIKASREARQDAIGNRQAQERIGISAKNAKISARSQRATARNYREDNKGGKNALTPGEKSTIKKERQNAAALVHNAISQVGMPHNAKKWALLESAAVEAGGSPREVKRAIAKLRAAQAAKNRKGYANRAAAERAGGAVHR